MKSFLVGKKSLESPALRPPHTHKPALASGIVRAMPSAPVVDVVKEGDKVVRIIVTCTCGEKIEIDCLYPAGG